MCNLRAWEINAKIDAALKSIASSSVIKFYPTYLVKITNLPLKIILENLAYYKKQQIILISFEFLCENCHRSLISSDSPDCAEEIVCKYCGEENYFEATDAIMTLQLDPFYRKANSNHHESPKKKRTLMLV